MFVFVTSRSAFLHDRIGALVYHIQDKGIFWNDEAAKGAVFHLIGAMSQFGKV